MEPYLEVTSGCQAAQNAFVLRFPVVKELSETPIVLEMSRKKTLPHLVQIEPPVITTQLGRTNNSKA